MEKEQKNPGQNQIISGIIPYLMLPSTISVDTYNCKQVTYSSFDQISDENP